MTKGCRYGTHRVIEPKGTLPQPAHRLDNTMYVYDNEVLIEVSTLNIDSASYTQIKKGLWKGPGEDEADDTFNCGRERKNAESCYRFRTECS